MDPITAALQPPAPLSYPPMHTAQARVHCFAPSDSSTTPASQPQKPAATGQGKPPRHPKQQPRPATAAAAEGESKHAEVGTEAQP